VGVVERNGELAGCVAASARLSYVDGYVTSTGYAGDLKVHPAHRDGTAADALTHFAGGALRTFGGNALLTLVTVLEGNRADGATRRRTARTAATDSVRHDRSARAPLPLVTD
jgi:hypothetical protein